MEEGKEDRLKRETRRRVRGKLRKEGQWQTIYETGGQEGFFGR